jgi:hypothetical protein
MNSILILFFALFAIAQASPLYYQPVPIGKHFAAPVVSPARFLLVDYKAYKASPSRESLLILLTGNQAKEVYQA